MRTLRTSRVIDRPDGRLPALTAEAQARLQRRNDLYAGAGPADNPEDRNLFERCITAGLPNVMLSQVYNNIYQVVQTRDHVLIVAEMMHDARIVPIDGRPHLPRTIRQLMGDSIGHWEGDTLVVETTNFSDTTNYRGSGETLVDGDVIHQHSARRARRGAPSRRRGAQEAATLSL